MNAGALEAVDRIVNRGGEEREVLAAVLDVLVGRGVVRWASVGEVERGTAGGDTESRPPGASGAVLSTSAGGDSATLDRVAVMVSHDAGGGSWRR